MAGETLTQTGYIKHHLTNLTFGSHPVNGWSFAHGAEEAKEMGFWAIHVDTMFWSIFLGALFLYGFRKAAVAATRTSCRREWPKTPWLSLPRHCARS